MESESTGKNRLLQLEPFSHQVGGQTSILLLDKNTICKPLIPNELNFYKTAPDCLMVFLPQLKGVVDVTFDVNDEGILNFTTSLPSKTSSCGNQINGQFLLNGKNNTKIEQKISIENPGGISSNNTDDCQIIQEDPQSGGQGCLSAELNPGALRWQKRQLQKLQATSNTFTQKFIMLENLTSKYEFPCVLDIKMGTRCHGDYISASKLQRLATKAANTTSATLGLRICGIQVYNQKSKQYIYHNKYYGRGLTAASFHEPLYQFFLNGTDLRHDIILQLMRKLQKLKEIILTLDTFRFYASSLLVVYDSVSASKQDVECPDHNNLHNGNATENCLETSGVHLANCPDDTGHCCNSSPSDNVTVKMIDFGHTIHEHMTEPHDIHPGPHSGYLFGLDSLISQLKLIQEMDSSK